VPMSGSQSPPGLEWLCRYSATLRAPEVIGPVPEGIRVNFYVTGGRCTGRIAGQLRAAGGDWLTIRSDGVGELDVRATLETDEGALIDLAYRGIGDLGPGGYAAFLEGRLPDTLALRTRPIMRTAHPDYRWLQRLFCVSIGSVDFKKLEVTYDVYWVN
jgi:hypothetical protein